MASTLKKSTAAVLTTRSALITAAVGKQTIVVTGTISNIDTPVKASHFATLEVQTGATYRVIVKDAPIPYGGSLQLPKIVLEAGDILHVSGLTNGVMEAYVSYIEKD